jgi:hypothetical protein
MHLNTHVPVAAHADSALPCAATVAKSQMPIRQVFRFVPLEGVGALVQDCLRAGMKKVSVVPNQNGSSCTLTIES